MEADQKLRDAEEKRIRRVVGAVLAGGLMEYSPPFEKKIASLPTYSLLRKNLQNPTTGAILYRISPTTGAVEIIP